MAIEERLERLEQELHRVQRRYRNLLVGCAACFASALALWLATPQALLADAAVAKEIRANRFVLVDGDGKERAEWNASVHRARMTFSDQQGTIRASFGLVETGAILGLFDDKGTARIALSAGEGGWLRMFGEGGANRATLGVNSITTPDGETHTYPDPTLLLFAADGTVRWQTP